MEPARRRIIKKVDGGHAHHGGAWKVAYADFVTAMMALFMVMWLLASTDAARAKRSRSTSAPASCRPATSR